MASATPPDPPPPSFSAAELRRRLLASTPPPLGDGLPAVVDLAPPPAPAKSSSDQVSTEDMLRKLRMPGQSTVGAMAAVGAAPDPAANLRPAPSVARFGAPAPSTYGSGSYVSAAPHGLGGSMLGGESPSAEIARLRSENKELRHLLDEMKQLLQEASDAEQTFAKLKNEADAALVEKQRQVDELTDQLKQIEEQISTGSLAPASPPKTRTELEEWGDELEQESAKLAQERRRLDDDRRQLREDEEALEKQMRDMEVSMARERALMARQETELKRLSAEIQHELELMQRGDVALREQMAKFQRRAAEVMTKPPGGSGVNRWPGR
jgi:DNA repair exonuclease SbcCD ATPase subunit